MGGSGAKTDRKPDRRQSNGARSSSIAPKKNSSLQKGISHSKSKRPVKASSTNSAKFKKPKHLQRKLEALTEENGTDKKRLLDELHDLNQTKKTKPNLPNLASASADTDVPARPAPSGQQYAKVPPTTRRNQQKQSHSQGPLVDSSRSFPNAEMTNVETHQTPQTAKKLKVVQGEQGSNHIQNNGQETNNAKLNKKPSNVNEKDDHSTHKDGNEDSDEEVQTNRRERGKRRRGRVDTSSSIPQSPVDSAPEQQQNDNNPSSEEKDAKVSKKRGKADDGDSRRCLGRKPVTDFLVGENYPAKVVYATSFGIFMDIGCHSDAFCHVSRLSDEYIESAVDQFPPGTLLETARVVEIDRSRKRITVSLQSQERFEDEMASTKARQDRRHKIINRGRNKPAVAKGPTSPSPPKRKPPAHTQASGQQEVTVTTVPVHRTTSELPLSSSAPSVVERQGASDLAPAELKRARKQARRADRRADRERQNETKQ